LRGATGNVVPPFRSVLLSVSAALIIFVGFAAHGGSEASANTVYGPYGDPGKTYQNNWASACRWVDTPGHADYSPCYRGIWSDTDTPSYYTAKVSEYAWQWRWVCIDDNNCGNDWDVLGSYPATQQAGSYATVNHCCGSWIGVPLFYADVHGQAQHWNVSLSTQTSWWTYDGYPF